jgi:hypothetical protein
MMIRYEFKVYLSGYGKNVDQAWLDAVTSLNDDPGEPGEVTSATLAEYYPLEVVEYFERPQDGMPASWMKTRYTKLNGLKKKWGEIASNNGHDLQPWRDTKADPFFASWTRCAKCHQLLAVNVDGLVTCRTLNGLPSVAECGSFAEDLDDSFIEKFRDRLRGIGIVSRESKR